MARVFLSNETYNAATSGAQVFGAAGTEQVNVFSGTTGVSVASSVERVDLSGNIADYTFSSFGAAMTIRDTAGNIVATVSDSGGKSVVFADGALSAAYAGTTLSLGGVALTGTAAAITPAAADIDATTTSDAPASTGGTTGGAAQTFTLTASSPSVTEGDTGTKNLTFTLTLDEAPTQATIINYQALTSTTATAGDDFEIAAGIVTFAAGQTVATVSITVNGDTNFEEDETVQVQFSGGALEAAVTATGTITNDDADPAIGSQSFTLTTGPDGFSGTANSDLFIASDATLSSADVLDGMGGSDVLRYASSGTTGTNESGFSTTGIETAQVTADDTGGTTFDVTGMSGLTTIANNNSSANLTFTGLGSIAAVEMESVSGGNTTVTYKDAALSGLADAQTITLNGNASNAGIAASTLSIGDTSGDGLETLNIATTGAASLLADLVTGAATVNVTGDKNLSIGSTGVLLDGATTVNASAFTGNLSVVLDSNGTAKDVTVTGGAGDDTANFSAGFEADDVFTGGDGIDTLGLTNAIATGTPGGRTTDVEQLSISDAGTGTIDMDNFSGITKVIYDAGFAANATATVDDAVTGLEVELDVTQPVASDGSLVVDLKTDGTSDALTITLDDIGAGEGLALLSAEDAETLNISADDDTSNGTGTLTIAALTATDATAINLSGDAAVTITGTNDPATPVLATLDASAMTDGLTISGTNFAAGGATIKLGSGNDVFNVATSSGADTFDLTAGGNDRIVYTTLAQSDSGDTDTITGFTAGSDDIDLRTFVQAVDTSSEFGGTFSSFALAQGALSGGGDNTGVLAVFQADASTLWVDVDDNGTLDAQDFRVVLDGVTKLEATDLSIGGSGNTITLQTGTSNVNATTKDNASNVSTNENDTITSTVANADLTTLNALGGTDTLTITDDVTTAVRLNNATASAALDLALTGVETVVFNNQTGLVDIGANNNGEDITVNGANGALTATAAANNQDFVVANTSGTTASTITLGGAFTGMTVSLGAAGDTVILTSATADASTVNGGTGTDTIAVTGAITVNLNDGSFSGFETLDLNDAGNAAQIVTLSGTEFRSVTVGDAADDVLVTAAQANLLTTIDAGADADGELRITDAGAFDITDATIAGTNDLGLLQFSAAGNNLTASGADLLGFVAITGGAGTDTVTVDLEGAATTVSTAGTGGDGVITAVENIVATDSGTGGTINLTVANASGVTSINTSAVTTAQTLDISGLTTANGATSVTLGTGADTLATSITGAGNNNLTLDFGAGSATVADIAAGGTGNLNLAIDATLGSTTAITFTAVTAQLEDFGTTTIDFGTDVTSLKTPGGTNNANQIIFLDGGTEVAATNATIDQIIFDVNGDGAFGAGDVQLIGNGGVNIVGANVGISLVGGDLVIA